MTGVATVCLCRVNGGQRVPGGLRVPVLCSVRHSEIRDHIAKISVPQQKPLLLGLLSIKKISSSPPYPSRLSSFFALLFLDFLHPYCFGLCLVSSSACLSPDAALYSLFKSILLPFPSPLLPSVNPFQQT